MAVLNTTHDPLAHEPWRGPEALSAKAAPFSQAGEAALEIASRGWPVFPCNHLLDLPGKRRNKLPLTENGFLDATRDPESIVTWWRQYPRAMIGVPAGQASGVWVLDVDIDPKKGLDGAADLTRIENEHGALPATWESRTPRGGRHLLFEYQDGITTSSGDLPASIDVRGEGGYSSPRLHAAKMDGVTSGRTV